MALLTVVLFGVATAGALVVGSVLGAYREPPDRVIAAGLALSSGALITALAFELFEPAYRTVGAWPASAGLLTGAAAFTGVKWWLHRVYDGAESGAALLASVTLDGVPENLALGIVLVGGGSGSAVAVLVAIVLSNLPEATGGAMDMIDQGLARPVAVAAWAGAGLVLAGAVVAGYTVVAPLGEAAIGGARTFAGGAVLAAVAVEILPDAYAEGGPLVAMATAVGFVVTFVLT